ncbi:MAG: SusD/RagB family nutrient-binding outer membrane lipoprotein, partial [Bergeyella zoohelcum]|nr:SusD/RagB family nutrient-binding outer membrane lipoprotein [Bergeyella zoohelcum]
KTNEQGYIAIAKLYRAILFYNLTLTFGDIPYSEAVRGEEKITQPKYDTQETVLAGILKELEEANSLISNGTVKGDIIYNGDTSKWKKFINSFRLKVLITLSKKDKVGGYNIASEFAKIATSEPLMMSIDDNAQLSFFDSADSRYTTFNDSNYGSSVYMANYFVDLFKNREDPRIFTFADQTTGAKEAGKPITDFTAYNGGNPVSPYSDNAALVAQKNISKVNIRFYKDATNEPSNILSYTELQFILAEASARGWISSSAKTHYDNAITSSFDFYNKYVKNASVYFSGFDINTYLTSSLVAYNTAGNLNEQVEQILTQKYMTMFHQGQSTAYYDYLRTGYPAFPLPSGMSQAPARYRYPQTEYNYNSANLKDALQKQFGGKDEIQSLTWWLK